MTGINSFGLFFLHFFLLFGLRFVGTLTVLFFNLKHLIVLFQHFLLLLLVNLNNIGGVLLEVIILESREILNLLEFVLVNRQRQISFNKLFFLNFLLRKQFFLIIQKIICKVLNYMALLLARSYRTHNILILVSKNRLLILILTKIEVKLLLLLSLLNHMVLENILVFLFLNTQSLLIQVLYRGTIHTGRTQRRLQTDLFIVLSGQIV